MLWRAEAPAFPPPILPNCCAASLPSCPPALPRLKVCLSFFSQVATRRALLSQALRLAPTQGSRQGLPGGASGILLLPKMMATPEEPCQKRVGRENASFWTRFSPEDQGGGHALSLASSLAFLRTLQGRSSRDRRRCSRRPSSLPGWGKNIERLRCVVIAKCCPLWRFTIVFIKDNLRHS